MTLEPEPSMIVKDDEEEDEEEKQVPMLFNFFLRNLQIIIAHAD